MTPAELEVIKDRALAAERCIVRNVGDAAEMIRELARLVGGLCKMVEDLCEHPPVATVPPVDGSEPACETPEKR